MTLKKLWSAWNSFWFADGSPIPIALFRIAIGLLVLCFCWWILPDALALFGQHAIVRPQTTLTWMQCPAVDILEILPKDDFWLQAMLALLMACGVCLIVGLFSRPSAFLVYLILLSLDTRNHFVLNSGIGIMCYMCLFLVFSRCGEALSFKRLLKIWRRKDPEFGPAKDGSVFGQRLVQVQLALVYWAASSWKLNGQSWIEGTAIFYTTQLMQFQRFSVPYVLDNLWSSRLLTWFTLLFEAGFPILIWIKEFRYPLLLIGVCFHLGMDWVLVIPLFQEVMIACYLCFIDPADLSKVMAVIRRLARRIVGKQLEVLFDKSNAVSSRLAETLRRLDILGLLKIEESNNRMTGIVVDGSSQGSAALRALSVRLPLLVPLSPFLLLPGSDLLVGKCGAKLTRIYCSEK